MHDPIPLVDLKAQYLSIQNEIDAAVRTTIEHTSFIMGPQVASFEKEFAAFVGSGYAVGASSGTTALHLALLGAGIGPGDEVIVPAHTFIASIEAIIQCGATPVFIDIKESTFTLDPEAIDALVTPRTRAILAVHLYGRCCEMEAILERARHHGLKVIEDAAQAHGASCAAGRVGALGDATAFSFFPGKNLGAFGDGGAVTLNDAALARRLAMLANHGREGKYEHELYGYNYRLDALQAAILSVKLKHLASWNAARRSIALRYNDAFADLPVVTPEAVAGHVFHLYVLRVRNRDALQAALKEQGIATGVHYPLPCHRQPCCRDLQAPPLPVTERVVPEIVSLPIYPELTAAQQDRVIAAVIAAVKG